MSPIFKELDIVVSTVKIRKVPIGTGGTIVFDYGNNDTYEVEFFKDHKTISIETVSKNQIAKRI